jgi:hypothetical protein
VEATVARMKKDGRAIAENVEKLLAAGKKAWYADDPKTASGRTYWDLKTGNVQPVQVPAGVWSGKRQLPSTDVSRTVQHA